MNTQKVRFKVRVVTQEVQCVVACCKAMRFEDASLLGRYALRTGKSLPTFRRSVVSWALGYKAVQELKTSWIL